MYIEVMRFVLLSTLCIFGTIASPINTGDGSFTAKCPDGYDMVYAGKCLRYYDTRPASFDRCEDVCQADGGHGISIQQASDLNYVSSYLYSAGMHNAAYISIGLKCATDEALQDKTFSWLDGSMPSYLPAIRYGSEDDLDHCENIIFVIPTNDIESKTWYGKQETEIDKLGCLCEVVRPDRPCGVSFSYNVDSQSCIRVGAEHVSWNDAQAICASEQNGALISIHSNQSNTFVANLANGYDMQEAVHIGFKLQGGETPAWIDNTPFDFTYFDAAMPNRFFGECGAMGIAQDKNKWLSIHCDDLNQLPYICHKPAEPMLAPVYCPTQFYLGSGDVYSPGYPLTTSLAQQSCEYLIAADPGHRIGITFVDYETNECCDELVLYEGATSENRIEYFSGKKAPDANAEYVTQKDNVLRMLWTSQTGYARGFHASFRSI